MQVKAVNSGQVAEKINLNYPLKRPSPEIRSPEREKPDPTASQQEPLQKTILADEEIIAAIETANQKFEYYDTRLEFSIHEQTHQIMVKIYKEDELIRELPPEKILDMVAQMIEMAGLLVDETA